VSAGITEKDFARIILEWFDENRRPLPWRETRDPYLIWLSEVILQQTRVAQGLSYYESLSRAFPTVADLAKAKEKGVLRLWQGLGYYSRARNLHRCARRVAMEMHGQFPSRYSELIKLPGIGPYTAAAVASIAFDEQVAVLDGNVFRVLSRIFGITADIHSPKGKKLFQQKAASLVPSKRPGDFNQGMMELGAIQCTPRNPQCGSCPFNKVCAACASDSVHLLPVKKKKAAVRHRYLSYVIFSLDGRIGLRARNSADIWRGLYDFYLVESDRPLTVAELKRRDRNLKDLIPGKVTSAGAMKHVLTHQKLHISFFHATTSKKNLTNFGEVNPGMAFYTLKQAARLPKPVPVKMWLDKMEMEGWRK
jgi:A/G-specific adenine glycosylase